MAFEVAWKNDSEPIKSNGRNLVKCEICGKTGLPFGDWGCYEIPVMSKMYDYVYWVCSDECDKKATRTVKEKRIKELS